MKCKCFQAKKKWRGSGIIEYWIHGSTNHTTTTMFLWCDSNIHISILLSNWFEQQRSWLARISFKTLHACRICFRYLNSCCCCFFSGIQQKHGATTRNPSMCICLSLISNNQKKFLVCARDWERDDDEMKSWMDGCLSVIQEYILRKKKKAWLSLFSHASFSLNMISFSLSHALLSIIAPTFFFNFQCIVHVARNSSTVNQLVCSIDVEKDIFKQKLINYYRSLDNNQYYL